MASASDTGGGAEGSLFSVRGDVLTLGTDLPQAATQQYGRDGIPPRPYESITPEDAIVLGDVLEPTTSTKCSAVLPSCDDPDFCSTPDFSELTLHSSLRTTPMLLPVTAGDIQDAVIPLLQVNALLTGMFPSGVADMPALMPTILDDDPLSIDQATGISIALIELADDENDGSLGGSGVGTRQTEFYFALLIYVWGANRDRSKKRLLSQITSQARAALMQTGLRIDPNPTPRQKWYSADFYKSPCTVYRAGGAYRQSITFIRYNSRFRTI